MKIVDCVQSSNEWLDIRTTVPTASEFSNLVSPAKLKVCDGKAVDTFIARKLAEKWLGGAIQSFQGNAMTEQGKVLEEEARPWYALQYNVEIETPGFILNDAETAGCSPDGIIAGQQRGLELKSPAPETHVKYLLAGGLPSEYLLQVQGSMYVTGFPEWEFVSWHRKFPAHVLTVKRDRAVQDAIAEAIGIYWEKFNAGWAKLLDANGGEEPTREYTTTYDADGAEVRTLKNWETSLDPIGEILEMPNV